METLGLVLPRPTLRTNDPRTKDSHESIVFRDVLLRYVDEQKLKRRNFDSDSLVNELQAAARISMASVDAPNPILLLKLPIAALLIAELAAAFDLHVIVIQRSMVEIERSRIRRGWSQSFGRSGAERLYRELHTSLSLAQLSYMTIDYSRLVQDPISVIERLVSYYDLASLRHNIRRAAACVRR